MGAERWRAAPTSVHARGKDRLDCRRSMVDRPGARVCFPVHLDQLRRADVRVALGRVEARVPSSSRMPRRSAPRSGEVPAAGRLWHAAQAVAHEVPEVLVAGDQRDVVIDAGLRDERVGEPGLESRRQHAAA